MGFRLWISVFSVTSSWILCSGLPAPAARTTAVSPQHHVRNKRCSCATFLDKECIYFCHLDIIWVNTPERVVSYGLGYAPRARRAVPDPPRCRCLRDNDQSCSDFCLRLKPAADERTRSTHGDRHAQRSDTGATERTVNNRRRLSQALRAALRTRTLLDKWAARRRHRARTRRPKRDASSTPRLTEETGSPAAGRPLNRTSNTN